MSSVNTVEMNTKISQTEQIRENEGILTPTKFSRIKRDYRRSYQTLATPGSQIRDVCLQTCAPWAFVSSF